MLDTAIPPVEPDLVGQRSAAEPGPRADRALLVLLAVFLPLMIAWTLVVPIFEAPDEPLHWQYARYLRDHRSLPIYGPGFMEANSPPLYYLLLAPLAVPSERPVHFRAENGSPGVRRYENRNDDLGRYWPLRAARLVTALMSALTVLFCYLAGREATGSAGTGLLAAGLVAFLPQFTFRGGNISNDALLATLCALSLYLMIRLIRRGFTWGLGIGLAAAVAGAFLSKISAIFLPIPLALALLSQKASWRTHLLRLCVLGGVILLLVGPWALRNQILYGDPFASGAMKYAVAYLIDIKPITSPFFRSVFPVTLFVSTIGLFGWMNLGLPRWIYAAFLCLGAAAIVGLVRRQQRREPGGRLDTPLLLTLIAFPLLNLLVVIHINLSFTQPQGRYMLPALPALAVLVALGLEGLRFWSRRAATVLLSALALLNLYILIGIVYPAYWPAPTAISGEHPQRSPFSRSSASAQAAFSAESGGSGAAR